MCIACARCCRRCGCQCLFSCAVPPALKITEVQKRIKRRPINVVARPQTLPNEILLDVLSCVNRRTLDNLCLIRRFSPLLLHCHQLRLVYEAYLSYSPSAYVFSVGFAVRITIRQHLRRGSPRETWITKKYLANRVNMKTRSLRRATDVFINSLLHSRVIRAVRFENLELNGYFVGQLKSIANRYVMNGESLEFDGVSLRLNVSPADFIGSFSSLHSLSRSTSDWLNALGLDDVALERLASNGVLDLSPRFSSKWNCRHLSEDALLAFAFGDSYADDQLRRLRGYGQLSETFMLKLVRARRESEGNHQLILDLSLDMKLVAAGVELSMDGLQQHGQYDDDKGIWRFTFADIPNFRIEYDDIMEEVRCWSNTEALY